MYAGSVASETVEAARPLPGAQTPQTAAAPELPGVGMVSIRCEIVDLFLVSYG